MLVYATVVRFAPDASATSIRRTIAAWIARKTGSRVGEDEISEPGTKRFNDPLAVRVEVDTAETSSKFESSIRVTHSDSSVAGRQWVVEFGYRGPSKSIVAEFSAVVQTNEISTLVATPVPLNPPGVVSSILSSGSVADSTPGLRVLPLTSANAEDFFLYDLLSFERAHPVVLVGPKNNGEYSVDVERLRSLLCGLAELRVIGPEDDTFGIARSMQGIPAPYAGAVAIVFPRSRFNAGSLPYWQLLKASDLQAPQVESPELAVLARVLHRTNLPTSWRHISPAVVAEARRQADSAALRRALASGSLEAGELNALIEQTGTENSELVAKNQRLEKERDEYWFKAEELEEKLEAKEKAIAQLNRSMQELQKRSAQSLQPILSDDARSAICECLVEGPTVLTGLRLVRTLFPDRLLVLPTAEKAAEEHWAFAHSAEAFNLMILLATSYWEALSGGKGDGEAKKVFPDRNFAAKETGTISKHARRARTFRIDDERELFMEPHLKIQRGPNEAQSWRLHFEWLAAERKIVIGHCGVHLPL